MHIMVIPSWYSSSRNKVHGSFFKEQFKALSNSGETITVAYNEIWPITMLGRVKEKRGISFNIEDGLRTYRYRDFNYFPKNPLMFRSFNKRMDSLYREIIKKEGKVDVIHAHSSFWGGIAATYISQKYHIPLVITEHSSLKYAQYVKESYKKHIFNTYDKADVLIAVGNGLKKEISEYVKRDIMVIHNMVDLKLFNNSTETRELDTFNLFSCAFLVEGKGMEMLIKAFNNVFKDKKAILKIGGDGPLREKLKKIIEDLKIESKVELIGSLSRKEVAEEMKKCDTFVLASEHETFGVVYIEALACGKPVIGTKNGGAEDIIKEYNGVLSENRNQESLEKALNYMYFNYKKYDSKMIREKTICDYSEKTIIENLKGVYKDLNGKSN